MPPEPQHIIQYWHSEDVPDYIAGLLETFRDLNPDMRHLVFSESSAAAFIEEHFEPRHLRAFQACAVPAMQADYLRYCAVLVLGGAYCDVDARCTSNFGSLIPAPGAGRLFRNPAVVINGLFAFGGAGHPLLELVVEIATANIERRVSDRVFRTTGPAIFTTLFWLHQQGSLDGFRQQLAKREQLGFVHSYLDPIDDFAQVARAFDGVTVSQAPENVWTGAPGIPLPYKETDAHHPQAVGRIFKEL